MQNSLFAAAREHHGLLSAIIAHQGTLDNHIIAESRAGGQQFHQLIGVVSHLASGVLMPAAIGHKRAQGEGIPVGDLFPLGGDHPGIDAPGVVLVSRRIGGLPLTRHSSPWTPR